MQGKVKRAFRLLWHDRGMVTTHKKITLGTSYLQGVWQMSGTANDARAYPDRRLSVCETGCVTKGTKVLPTAKSDREPCSPREKSAKSDKHDSLLGSLLAETFFGAVFGPLLPVWAQGIDWTSTVGAVDEVWTERRMAPSRIEPRAPSHSFF